MTQVNASGTDVKAQDAAKGQAERDKERAQNAKKLAGRVRDVAQSTKRSETNCATFVAAKVLPNLGRAVIAKAGGLSMREQAEQAGNRLQQQKDAILKAIGSAIDDATEGLTSRIRVGSDDEGRPVEVWQVAAAGIGILESRSQQRDRILSYHTD